LTVDSQQLWTRHCRFPTTKSSIARSRQVGHGNAVSLPQLIVWTSNGGHGIAVSLPQLIVWTSNGGHGNAVSLGQNHRLRDRSKEDTAMPFP